MADESAGLAECKQLYELSGWQEEEWGDQYRIFTPGQGDVVTPAYTLGTLLHMLPAHTLTKYGNATWQARWVGHVPWQSETPAPVPAYRGAITAESRTNPANALARLAIKLFEAGVLLTSKGE